MIPIQEGYKYMGEKQKQSDLQQINKEEAFKIAITEISVNKKDDFVSHVSEKIKRM